MAAWFNKKTARAIAKMAESLKAESSARAQAEENLKAEVEAKAAMERKVKAEAEKLLVDQFNSYSIQIERAEAKVKEAMATASTQITEAEEKVLSYEVALAQTEEKLKEAREQLKSEALAKAKAEEILKSEREERKRVEAQLEDVTASAKAKAEEKAQSYEATLAQTEEKLKEAREQLKSEALVRAKTEESLKSERVERKRLEAQLEDVTAYAQAKAEEKILSYAAGPTEAAEKLIETKEQVRTQATVKAKKEAKSEIEEHRRFYEEPVVGVNTFGRIHRGLFHPVNIKRKLVLLLVIAIFSAITFALNIINDAPTAEPGDAIKQVNAPAPVTLAGSDTDRERLSSNVTANPPLRSLSEPEPDVTNSPVLNYESADNITFKVDEEKSVPVAESQSLTIKSNLPTFKITASAIDKSNIVQFSDDTRLETRAGSYIFNDFSDVSLPAKAVIKSAVLFVEHFEEERFSEGKLEWAVGSGWPDKPVIWAAMKAPVREGESSESVDAWDITSVAGTVEKINSLQLQIKNNNNIANGKTFVDYAYVVIEYH